MGCCIWGSEESGMSKMWRVALTGKPPEAAVAVSLGELDVVFGFVFGGDEVVVGRVGVVWFEVYGSVGHVGAESLFDAVFDF